MTRCPVSGSIHSRGGCCCWVATLIDVVTKIAIRLILIMSDPFGTIYLECAGRAQRRFGANLRITLFGKTNQSGVAVALCCRTPNCVSEYDVASLQLHDQQRRRLPW